MSGPYHRLESPTQTEADARLQVSTMMVCGRGARQAGGGMSDIPSVKAYLGPLPGNRKGIEFTTDIVPSSIANAPPGGVFWHAGRPGVIVNGPSACIPVTSVRTVCWGSVMVKQLRQPIEPSDNFFPVVTIRRSIDAMAKQLHLSLEQGADDLDRYQAAQLVTEAGCKFVLMQYRGHENGMVDIYIPTKLPNYRQCIRDIIAELGIPDDEIIERETAYEQF